MKEEIAKECSTANQLKSALDDRSVETRLASARQELDAKKTRITAEIKRLQQELSDVEVAITANNADAEKLTDGKRQLSSKLKTSLMRIRSLHKGLITVPSNLIGR